MGLLSEPSNRVKSPPRPADSSIVMRFRIRALAPSLLSGLLALALPLLIASPARAAAEAPGKILFTGTEGAGNTHIYVVNGDGTGLTRLTALKYDDEDARWSPNGNSIVFSSNRSGFWDIWMKNLRTGKVVQLTKAHLVDSQPVWSPDGTTIAFIRANGGNANVFVLDLATRQVQQVTNSSGNDADPAWSADSQWVAYDAFGYPSRNLFYVNVSTHTNTQIMPVDGNSVDPAPSPDNDTLAFASDRSGGYAIWAMDVESHTFTQLTDGTTTDRSPSWSPYGTKIVFSRSSGGGDPALYTMTSDGSGQAQLSTGPVTDDTNPEWFPLTAGQRTYDDQAKNVILKAPFDANWFYVQEGSYGSVTVTTMANHDPSIAWVSGGTASTGPSDISIATSGDSQTFAAAVLSNSGECFQLRVVSETTVTYGLNAAVANCTGSQALSNATLSQWPV